MGGLAKAPKYIGPIRVLSLRSRTLYNSQWPTTYSARGLSCEGPRLRELPWLAQQFRVLGDKASVYHLVRNCDVA
jgi:hypothetical protein